MNVYFVICRLSWFVSFCMYHVYNIVGITYDVLFGSLHFAFKGGGTDDLKFRIPWHCAMVGGRDEALALDYFFESTKCFFYTHILL